MLFGVHIKNLIALPAILKGQKVRQYLFYYLINQRKASWLRGFFSAVWPISSFQLWRANLSGSALWAIYQKTAIATC